MVSKCLRLIVLLAIPLVMFGVSRVQSAYAMVTCSMMATQSEDSIEIDVASIPVEERVEITGLVLNEKGDPVSGANVVLEQAWKEGGSSTVTDAAGKFSLIGQRKFLRLASVKASMNDEELIGSARLPYDDQLIGKSPLEIKLATPKDVKVQVVDADKRPLPDAQVGFMTGSILQGVSKTDADGNAVLKVPQTVTVDTVFAKSNGHGFDYRMFRPGRRFRGDKKQGKVGLPDEPVTLVLDGAAPVRIRLIDEEGLPIPEVDVSPWLFRKPSENDSFNMSYVGSRKNLIHQKTNMNGEVVFDWLPKWQQDRITFWPSLEGYVRQQQIYDRDRDGDEFTIVLRKQVSISGCVNLPNGKPCPKAKVAIVGKENGLEHFRKTVETDDKGRYEAYVDPDMVYLIVSEYTSETGDRFASAKKDGFAVWPDKPIDGMDFELRPATRVFGKLTDRETKKPVPNFYVRLRLIAQSSRDAGIELPQRGEHGSLAQPDRWVTVQTDGEGNYEFWVGDGEFSLAAANDNEPFKIKVAGEPSFERNLTVEVPETKVFKGQVFDGKNNIPVANARLDIAYKSMKVNRAYSMAKTDAKGKFAFDRSLYPIVVKVTNEDGTKGAIFEAETSRNGTIVRLSPLATAVGVLVDEKSGLPVSGVKLSYGYKIDLENGLRTSRFGGTAMTDEDGKFKIEGLFVGKECQVSMPVSKKGRIRNVTAFTPEDESELDLGVCEVETSED